MLMKHEKWSTIDQAWCDLCEAHETKFGPVVVHTGKFSDMNSNGLSVLDYLGLVALGLAEIEPAEWSPCEAEGQTSYKFALTEKGIEQSKRARTNESGAEVPEDLWVIAIDLMKSKGWEV